MDTQRLQHLITILENVPAEKFDLETWTQDTPCGTVFCAIGWACMDQKFLAQGLCLSGSAPRLEVDGDVLSNWDAVEVFFELTADQAIHLFCDEAYGGGYDDNYDAYTPSRATAADVIKRIRELLETA